MGALVISGRDTVPVLEFAEHIFNLVPLPVQDFIILDWLFPVFPGRDAGCYFLFRSGFAEPIGIIPSVSQQMPGRGKVADQGRSAFIVTDLAGCQVKQNRSGMLITDCMQFAVQPAFRATNVAGNILFLPDRL